ncbi:4322_t:CDS:2 [Ambispora gerdemannii]|uniref:4322_t:CDS:1 n=1 Tax=Ambispora gerdemannii TaxID=144530 RepID=A0A9N9DBJ7_9GLOM|nr:4322_t:CDS:2 [Ambispora gerdemannii]
MFTLFFHYVPTSLTNWTPDHIRTIFTTLLIAELSHALAHIKVLLSLDWIGGRYTAPELWSRWYYFVMDLMTVVMSFAAIHLYLENHRYEDAKVKNRTVEIMFYVTRVFALGHFLLHLFYISGWFKGRRAWLNQIKQKVKEAKEKTSNQQQDGGESVVFAKSVFLGAPYVEKVLIWSAADSWEAKKACEYHWRQTIGTSYDIFVHSMMLVWHGWVLSCV